MNIDILKYLPANVVGASVSVLTIVIFTRLFSAEDFGLYALTIISAGFFHMAFYSWLEAATARFYARAKKGLEHDKAALDDFYKTIYGAALPIVIISVLMMGFFLYAFWSPTQLSLLLGVAFLNSGLLCFFNIRQEAYQASQNIRAYSFNHAALAVLTLFTSITLFYVTDLGVLAPFIGALSVTSLALITQIPFFITIFKRGQFRGNHLKGYALYGVPLAVSLVLAYLLEAGDLYYIKYFLGAADVGAYNAGYSLASRPVDLLITWCATALMPLAIITYEESKTGETEIFLKSFLATLITLAMPAAIGICLVSKDLSFVLGESVRDGAETVMPWIAISALLAGVFVYYFQQIYALIEKTKLFAWLILLPLALNIVANIILIPKLGIVGAAIGTLLAYLLAIVISFLWLKPYIKLILPWGDISKSVFASAIMGVCVWALPLSQLQAGPLTLGIKSLIGAGVYVALAYILNILDFRGQISDRFLR